jgi:hypothetical protein
MQWIARGQAALRLGVPSSTLGDWERSFGFPQPRPTPFGEGFYRGIDIEGMERSLQRDRDIDDAVVRAQRLVEPPSDLVLAARGGPASGWSVARQPLRAVRAHVLRGRRAHDRDGRRLGAIEEVLLDPENGRRWARLELALHLPLPLGTGRYTLVPLARLGEAPGRLMFSFASETIRSAPIHSRSEALLSGALRSAYYLHYGVRDPHRWRADIVDVLDLT